MSKSKALDLANSYGLDHEFKNLIIKDIEAKEDLIDDVVSDIEKIIEQELEITRQESQHIDDFPKDNLLEEIKSALEDKIK